MRKFTIITILLITLSVSLLGQSGISLSQYTTTISAINPAYSGVSGRFTGQLVCRNQWVGIEGAPQTNALIINTPITNYNVGLGALIIHEKVGAVNEYRLSLNTAYNVNLNSNTKLSFGINAIVAMHSMDYLGNDVIDNGDPYFSNLNDTKTYLNFGAGIYLYSKKYFIGYSATPLLKNIVKIVGEGQSSYYQINNTINHYLIGAYAFEINEQLTLKPSFLIKATKGIKPTTDLSLTAIYNNKFWLGTSYRTSKAMSFTAQMQVSKKIRLGYSYDFGTSREYSLNTGSHEIVCTFDIQLVKKKFITPRYF